METKLTKVDPHVVARPDVDTCRVTLVVIDHDGPSTKVLGLDDGAQLSLGRSRTCDVRIDSERVSRTHVVFTRRGMEVEVADAGSRNGTFVNGVLISGPRLLSSGDEVTAGSATVAVGITKVAARQRMESTRYLEERLAAEVDRGLHFQRRFALVLIELDGPPDVVDEAGDRLSATLRPMESIAEYTPGVFAVVTPELDAAAAERAALLFASAATTCDGAPVKGLAVAVGVAAFPEHSTTVGGMIARARAALEAARGRRANASIVAVPPAEPDAIGEVIIADPQMARIFDLVRKVADHSINVLVRGETGTGKEVVASAIHTASDRRDRPLVRLNCASLPEALLESELFGYEKGAFTGADRRKLGYFEAAAGGTLFLDEVGEMAPALQARLLRVLETRKITRVGGTEEIAVDVRVIFATHRDLEAEVKQGRFRQDLLFRIGAFTIAIPPLRDRPGEIEPLARSFIQSATASSRQRPPTISPAAALALRRHAWPGNIRELRNAIERALVLCSRGVIDVEDLPDSIRDTQVTSPVPASLPAGGDVRDHLADLERGMITAALEASGGNQTEAAKQLGISRRALIYRMEKHGLKPVGGRR